MAESQVMVKNSSHGRMPSLSPFAAVPWKKKLANFLFPTYIRLLDQINHNALVKQWIREHCDVPVFPNRIELYRFVESEYLRDEAISYLEFGVYRGASIKAWSGINRHPASRFTGFDSFVGLPEDWNSRNKKGGFDVGGAIPSIGDERVAFINGWFQETLPPFLKEFRSGGRLVVNNDCDLYSSTAFCLAQLDPFLRKGAIIIFDEFSSPLHEFRAWHDYLRAFMRKAKPIAMTADYASQVAFMFE